MTIVRFKQGVFLLEGLNAFATAFYFNYLFFYLRSRFGFSNIENLLCCALNGFIYIFGAYKGGKFGQKHGYIFALRIGCAIMAAALTAGCFVHTGAALVAVMACWTVGMSITWPTLEALASEKEPPSHLPKMLGIYNIIWAGGAAMAYFSGGAVVEALGWLSIFWVPAGLHVLQLLVAIPLGSASKQLSRMDIHFRTGPTELPHARHPRAKAFLKLAWLANPFSYIAINAAIPLMPELAERLELSPRETGFYCSIWFFSRMATFLVLALWQGWHYRFRWLFVSYVGVLISFIAMLLSTRVIAFIIPQIFFGWCIGLIYYSSLYYSMDAGDEKGSHGGIHEAAIGVGIFGGPAIGALSLELFPGWRQSSVYGVALVVAAGLIGLVSLRFKTRH